MPKPTITSMFKIKYVLEGDARIKIVSEDGGKSYQTISFPKGTEIDIYVSKLPVEEKQ